MATGRGNLQLTLFVCVGGTRHLNLRRVQRSKRWTPSPEQIATCGYGKSGQRQSASLATSLGSQWRCLMSNLDNAVDGSVSQEAPLPRVDLNVGGSFSRKLCGDSNGGMTLPCAESG